jgi:hypothetical protein
MNIRRHQIFTGRSGIGEVLMLELVKGQVKFNLEQAIKAYKGIEATLYGFF